MGLQLQERQICVAVVRLFFALERNIFLKDIGRFWIVSVQTIQDGIDVLWTIRRVVEGDSHVFVCCLRVWDFCADSSSLEDRSVVQQARDYLHEIVKNSSASKRGP